MKHEAKLNNTQEVDAVRQSQENNLFKDWYPVRCTLHGTSLCRNPNCTGYGEACPDSVNHSGR